MAEHVPYADRLKAETDAIIRLWKERRWLAIAALGILVLYSAYSTCGWIWGAAKIQGLQSENRELQRDKQQLQSQLNGVNIAVAPLIERAGKEFPGEEINKSLKKIVDRLEKQNPLMQPIASASATVDLRIKSSDGVNAHFMDQGGYAVFGNGNTALLETASHESWGRQTGKGEVQYHGTFAMPANCPAVGKPIQFLKQAGYIQTEFFAMPTNSVVLGGEVALVINGNVRLNFTIPEQQSNERRVFNRNLGIGLKALSSE
ncbi:MAG: hypothetical protein NT105_12020 [Verrucomicrobia bacterium]|nr:hypothetical protein [Verrucomicrobiota bacterium]